MRSFLIVQRSSYVPAIDGSSFGQSKMVFLFCLLRLPMVVGLLDKVLEALSRANLTVKV